MKRYEFVIVLLYACVCVGEGGGYFFSLLTAFPSLGAARRYRGRSPVYGCHVWE